MHAVTQVEIQQPLSAASTPAPPFGESILQIESTPSAGVLLPIVVTDGVTHGFPVADTTVSPRPRAPPPGGEALPLGV